MIVKYINPIVTSGIFFYIACILAVWCFMDYAQLKGNAVSQTMSRFVPGIHYFDDFVDRQGDFDKFKLHQCIAYHRRVVSFFTYQKSEALQMLGFCYDRLGDQGKASKSYESAIEANSQYIWPYYNLGIYAYKKGNYRKAVDYFQQALQKDLKINVMMLMRSKIFTDVRLSDRPDYNILEGIMQSRTESYVFMMESLSKLESYEQLFNTALLGLKEGLGQEDIFLYYAGKAAFYQKSYDRAVELLQLAVQKNPQNPEALFYLAQCMHAAGKKEIASKFSAMAQQIHQQQGSGVEKQLNSRVRFF